MKRCSDMAPSAGDVRKGAEKMKDTLEDTLCIDGWKADYASFGKGTRPLVLIQGLGLRGVKGAGTDLSRMFRIFRQDFRIYVFDRRDPLPDGFTAKEMADDLARCMEQLGISRADVIGISQGGMLALCLALDHPELVDRLVLGVTSSRTNDMIRDVVGRWAAFAKENNYRALVEDMLPLVYSERYQRLFGSIFPLILKMVDVIPPERFAAMAQACMDFDVYDRLDEIHCPVYVIGGELDKVVGPQASRDIAEKLHCGLYMYENLGHSAYEEAKDFNSRIYDFLMES